GREASTEALGWLARTESERDEAVPPLIKALKDDAVEVRRNAAAALGRIGDPRAREGIQAALQDKDEWVREVVADALKKLEGPSSE
ncbi:MAG: HEAT repeat domain-containing protein, partial [Deltaproteobacteria bacterium]|nr:HEAT repeat domain-containing protein [Deltaproteobacteria bacterium]